ncbi:hypothetical protein Lbir_2435 [Legionella birminghamensis]|uniref:Uncharacterized protein n=1 Tax=Legionella birminghamensis TaxID=28083 RepID=A0A378IDX7_9GAMM|nr:hypothetical protein [Legionella birminghamensis]KTC68902.1 hypothetical protein Lbir_2435 [Legionella birminghamensis]STX33156.1 Uncharacterised protein [Legionella birminghamensis]
MLSLITATARVLGEATTDKFTIDKIERYPFLRILQMQDQVEYKKILTQQHSLKGSLTLMASLFYILHFHLEDAQIGLLPALIRCRPKTTKEECDSEIALFSGLYGSSALYIIQMTCLKNYIDYAHVLNHPATQSLKAYLPDSRMALLEALIGSSKKPAELQLTKAFLHDLKLWTGGGRFEKIIHFIKYTLAEMDTLKPENREKIIEQLRTGSLQHYYETHPHKLSAPSSSTGTDASPQQAAAQFQPIKALIKFFSRPEPVPQRDKIAEINALFDNALSRSEKKAPHTEPQSPISSVHRPY